MYHKKIFTTRPKPPKPTYTELLQLIQQKSPCCTSCKDGKTCESNAKTILMPKKKSQKTYI